MNEEVRELLRETLFSYVPVGSTGTDKCAPQRALLREERGLCGCTGSHLGIKRGQIASADNTPSEGASRWSDLGLIKWEKTSALHVCEPSGTLSALRDRVLSLLCMDLARLFIHASGRPPRLKYERREPWEHWIILRDPIHSTTEPR